MYKLVKQFEFYDKKSRTSLMTSGSFGKTCAAGLEIVESLVIQRNYLFRHGAPPGLPEPFEILLPGLGAAALSAGEPPAAFPL